MKIEALKEAAERGTKGPWKQNGHAIEGPFTPTGRESIGVVSCGGRPRSLADAALIVTAVNHFGPLARVAAAAEALSAQVNPSRCAAKDELDAALLALSEVKE